MRLAGALAVAGALLVAVGAGLAWLPAGLIVAGVEMVVAAYVVGYLGARREVP